MAFTTQTVTKATMWEFVGQLDLDGTPLPADFMESQTLFEYSGIDILQLLKDVVDRSKAANVVSLQKDVRDMVVLGMERGNYYNSYLKKCNADASTRINSLVGTYSIQESCRLNMRTALTFTRVGQLFPQICFAYSEFWKSAPVDPEDFFRRHNMSGSPKQVLAPNFAMLIPDTTGPSSPMPNSQFTNAHRDQLYDMLATYQVECSEVVKSKSKVPVAKFAEVRRFIKVSHEQSHVPNSLRYSLLIKAKILNSRGQLKADVAKFTLEPDD